jgi:hypothetical protein
MQDAQIERETALALADGVPPPLSPFVDVVISPENIAAEQRLKKASRLPLDKRLAFSRELTRLQKQLSQVDYDELAARTRELRVELQMLQQMFEVIQDEISHNPAPDTDERYEELCQSLIEKQGLYRGLQQAIRPHREAGKRRDFLANALEDHRAVVRREDTEKTLNEMMIKESQIYERLIIDKWTRLGFCYKYKVGGKDYVERVKFSRVSITLDAIYYQIDASYQTLFKNWRTNVPDGVYIVRDLLNDETLTELTITCQRQVTGTYSHHGAWVIVHRLESSDGLMNYVAFPDVMQRYPYQHHDRMPLCVGVAAQREVQWVNLSEFPHWLVGGFTNSGKSNFVNSALCTLISQQTPEDLRLVLIDLKGGLEFDFYSGIPHLHGQIVDTVPKVADSLAELEGLMHARFRKFRGLAKRLEEYRIRRPSDKMPRVLVVFDEVASIMDHGEVTRRIMSSLRELTRMGRAVGIHIMLCTQRPDVKAIDGNVKTNLAVRISGRMTTSADSVTILGNSMARDLAAIAGRMVMQIGPDPMPVQTPHILQEDVERALARALDYPTPPPLDIPESAVVVYDEWTVERVVALSVDHLGGNITAKAIYEAADDLSKGQARKLVEQIWNMREVSHNGTLYRVQQGARRSRSLVAVVDALPAGDGN